MALTKEEETQVTVLADGQLQVRTDVIIKEDGVELSRTFHRKVVDVGEDVSAEVQVVIDLAGVMHTPARISARAAVRAAKGI